MSSFRDTVKKFTEAEGVMKVYWAFALISYPYRAIALATLRRMRNNLLLVLLVPVGTMLGMAIAITLLHPLVPMQVTFTVMSIVVAPIAILIVGYERRGVE